MAARECCNNNNNKSSIPSAHRRGRTVASTVTHAGCRSIGATKQPRPQWDSQEAAATTRCRKSGISSTGMPGRGVNINGSDAHCPVRPDASGPVAQGLRIIVNWHVVIAPRHHHCPTPRHHRSQSTQTPSTPHVTEMCGAFQSRRGSSRGKKCEDGSKRGIAVCNQ